MAAIKSKDTKPELFFRRTIFSYGLRFRKNTAYIFGQPDIFLKKYRTAIFIHGCFWHRHKDCKYSYTPKSHIEFWKLKFENNIKRDKLVRERLLSEKIKCFIVWECTVNRMMKDSSFAHQIITCLFHFLVSDNMYLEI